MADLPCQGSPSSNNSVANSVPGSARSLSFFPEGLTVQGETLSEVGQHSLSSHKSKHKNQPNDSFLEKGSRTELCNFSLRLGTSDPKDEGTDKHGDTKIDNGELPKTRKKQMVTEVSNLEEKRSLDIADAVFGNDISKVMPVRLFNFQLREISNEPQNLSSAISQSEEPSANKFSMSPLSEQHSCSPYRNDKFMIFTGGVIENNQTGCPFVPPANSLPVFRTQPISTRKPPLPPGAVTHLKGGVAHKTNKVYVQSMTQDSRKHLRVSEIRTKNFIPTAGSDKEGCLERGNSCPLYRRTAITDTSRRLTVKSVMFDKVSSAATNPLMNLVTLSDNIQAAFPGSSREGRLSHPQDILPFSNYNMKKTLGSEGNVESDNKNASSLDHKRKFFQRSQYNVTGTVHGVDLEVMQSLQDGDPGNLKSENLPPEKSNSSHHNLQPSIIENQMDTVIRSSSEFCMDNTQERWKKRLKWTHETDEKMLESTCSEITLDTQRQNMQILGQCGGLKGSRDSEAVRLHHAVGFTRASEEVSEHHRSTACEKDAQKQHCGSPIQNRGDIMASSLHKHPHCIDHQVSSSFLDDNTLNRNSVGQNTMDPASHSTNGTELQTKVSSSGKGSSSRLQKKIDMASILSHPWIRRWRPSYPIASSMWEMHHSSLVNKEISPRSLPQLFAPMKMMPSAAALAIVGIAARQFQPCQLQKKGSFSVWTAVGFTMNGTVE